MQKPNLWRTSHGDCKKSSLIIKSMLLTAACFSFFVPVIQAQKQSIDVQVLVEMMENRSPNATAIYQKISAATDLTGLVVPLSIVATGIATHEKNTIQKGIYIAESVAASTLLTCCMKYTIKRQRPFQTHPMIVPASTGGSPSFPSGHTSEAFATATAATLSFPKWYVAAPAYAWAAAVGYSRMYLGVHYPSDVLAGAVVGAGSAWLMYKVNKRLFKKKPENKL
jgi:hypothetical protein